MQPSSQEDPSLKRQKLPHTEEKAAKVHAENDLNLSEPGYEGELEQIKESVAIVDRSKAELKTELLETQLAIMKAQ